MGIDLVHVPYKGQAPALNDLLGGQVTLMFGNWPELRTHVRSGQLVALGMATAQRSPDAAQIPTLREQGLDVESNSWSGLMTRSGVPAAALSRLDAALASALRAPAVVQAFQGSGVTSMAGTPAEFDTFIRSEIDKYARVIALAGITPDH